MTKSKGQSFWATLPGLITAIAGMVTAFAVLITTLASLPASSSAQPRRRRRFAHGVRPRAFTLGQRTRPGGRRDPLLRGADGPGHGCRQRRRVFGRSGDRCRATRHDRPSTRQLPGLIAGRAPDRLRQPTGGGNRDIWVLEADGSYTPLTADARDDAYANWSPDGSRVAWSAGTAGQREFWVMSAADGSGARRLTTGADDLLPSWSSSGLVAFERHAGTSSEIWVVDPSGGGASARVTTSDGGGSDPAWSPDGRRLAFSRQVDGIHRIFVASADGQTDPRSLTPSGSCDCEEPTWSPDGTQIAYVGPGTGVIRPIMIVPVAGGTPRRVTTNGLGPSWAG